MISAQDIYAAVQRREAANRSFRRWLGASIVGSCTRHVALTFRSAYEPNFGGRILRVFENGKKAEDRIIADLETAGLKIHSRQKELDLEGGKGHVGVTLDGIAEEDGSSFVLELKTADAKSWRDISNNGVFKTKPQHYAQMQFGMLLTGLPAALYVVENKDTNDLYLERVSFDKDKANALKKIALRIITDGTGERCHDRLDWWVCKMCPAFSVCKGTEFPRAHCLTCCHATAVEDAKWTCAKYGKTIIPDEHLPKGCPEHIILPWMVNLPAEFGDYCVKYTTPTGVRIWNCPRGSMPPIDDGETPIILPSAELAGKTWGDVVAENSGGQA